jgi:hypothetical protein
MAVGCGLGSSDEVSRGEFSSELVHAVCDTVSYCCEDAALEFDPRSCRDSLTISYGGPLQAPGVKYDAVRAADCIDQSRRLTEGCQQLDSFTCSSVFTGTVPPGGACSTSYQCDPGPTGFAVCGNEGVCVLPARGLIGQPCSYSCLVGNGRPDCRSVYSGPAPSQSACFDQDGLFCFLPPEGAASCQPLAADCRQHPPGETPCPAGTLCDANTGGCTPAVPLGGNCTAAKCGDDGWCANPGVCAAKFPVAARCDDSVQCSSGRCYGGFCKMFSPAAAAMCRGPLP